MTSPDLYSTVLDAAGVPVPNGQGVDGESLRPLLRWSDGTFDRDALFWHYPHRGNQGGTPAAAVRTDCWKLVEFFEGDHVEPCDLDADIREARDLGDDCPETVNRLRERLRAWQDDVSATFPSENPA